MNTLQQTPVVNRLLAGIRATAITWSVAVVVLILFVLPQTSAWFQYDRQAIVAGQWWRLLTGYLVHWNFDHLFWDLLMFVVLGCLVETQSRWQLSRIGLIAALAISAGMWWCRGDIAVCRGLSGIDTALFTYLAIVILTAAWTQRQWSRCVVVSLLLAGFCGKILFEFVTGRTLFVASERAGFAVVMEAHLLGALVGVAAACSSMARAHGDRRCHHRTSNSAKPPWTCRAIASFQ